jgi:RND family efflux transporter MFP subunit
MTVVIDQPRKSRRALGAVIGGSLMLVLALGIAFWGISTRARTLTAVTNETREMAVPTVAVVRPGRGTTQDEVVLPGTMQAFTDAPIYARVNGYLKKWYVDIGTHVRSGQLLADIDTPETDQQLEQARADLATAEATARLAQVTADRYKELMKTDSIAQQDLDNASGSLEARLTAVQSARANVKRLEQLHAFGQILAPFDGVITARNTDVGALIDSGSNARELFHLVAVHRLRVFVNVPQVYSQAARAGLKAELTLAEFPGRGFVGTLARRSESIDVTSRTLLTEIDIDNPTGELLPGSYAEVHLKLPSPTATFTVPVSSLLFRSEGLQIATVIDGRAKLTQVTVGRDFGNTVEILSGLNGQEPVVVNPPDSVESGEPLRVVTDRAGSGARP